MSQEEAEVGACVYVIGSQDSPLVKIGRSTNVLQRLAAIQRMSPLPLVVLRTYPGGSELETALHRHFQDHRTHGEWFALDGDPVKAITAAVEQIKNDRNSSPKASSASPKESAATNFLVAREIPSSADGLLFQADPQKRQVEEWPQSGMITRPYRVPPSTPHCRCGHAIGIHSTIRPHQCSVDGGQDAEWCTCLGYEGPLPPELTGYDLPGHNWRHWREEGHAREERG
ncbi:GIY-YIG nuclease family protein [Streptomyces misionensis]|uniref:GIY-YIG nuclease family protein n=1 Tax=Streptomyces misionensis TaxID=67331 RepID=UPI00339F367A